MHKLSDKTWASLKNSIWMFSCSVAFGFCWKWDWKWDEAAIKGVLWKVVLNNFA